MLKLKVCGLNNNNNFNDISILKPEFVGLNFYAPSKRYVKGGMQISAPEGVELVGVFVNENLKNILKRAQEYGLTYIQLHGDEPPEFCEQIQAHDLKVIKVFRVDGEFDFKDVAPFVGKADFFLFDAGGKDYGGNGVVFNWSALKDYPFDTPYFLAGGLSPDNIQQVFEQKLPKLYALDVNSGYETMPGIKDVNKVEELIKILRANDSSR
ncbi:MAG: phosphoribosylanthranilate isomerase [Candidatus Cyclobacteriaceae bacterium M2_1C_046]